MTKIEHLGIRGCESKDGRMIEKINVLVDAVNAHHQWIERVSKKNTVETLCECCGGDAKCVSVNGLYFCEKCADEIKSKF